MKVLELMLHSTGYKKQYLIGAPKDFQTLEPSLERIIDPNLKGVIDYVTYNADTGNENIGIPVIVPITYDLGDFSYSPTLTIEERKDRIVKSWEQYEVEVVKWEEI